VAPPSFENPLDRRCATIQLARRFGETDAPEELLGQLQHEASLVANAAGNVAVDVQILTRKERFYTGSKTVVRHITNAWSSDPYNTFVNRSRQALSMTKGEVRTGKWKLGRLGMGTAGSLLVNQFKIPTIGYGPGNEDEAHQPNEKVKIDSSDS